jgi:hypothetical protein
VKIEILYISKTMERIMKTVDIIRYAIFHGLNTQIQDPDFEFSCNYMVTFWYSKEEMSSSEADDAVESINSRNDLGYKLQLTTVGDKHVFTVQSYYSATTYLDEEKEERRFIDCPE